MTNDGPEGSAPTRPAARARLANLDRRIVPEVAMRLDRLLTGARAAGPGRLVLGRRERRILGALAILLLACAAALTLIGG